MRASSPTITLGPMHSPSATEAVGEMMAVSCRPAGGRGIGGAKWDRDIAADHTKSGARVRPGVKACGAEDPGRRCALPRRGSDHFPLGAGGGVGVALPVPPVGAGVVVPPPPLLYIVSSCAITSL